MTGFLSEGAETQKASLLCARRLQELTSEQRERDKTPARRRITWPQRREARARTDQLAQRLRAAGRRVGITEGSESQGRTRSRGAMCDFTDGLKGSLWAEGAEGAAEGQPGCCHGVQVTKARARRGAMGTGSPGLNVGILWSYLRQNVTLYQSAS